MTDVWPDDADLELPEQTAAWWAALTDEPDDPQPKEARP